MAGDGTDRSSDTQIQYRRLRAPKGDGESLFDPSLAACEDAIEQNILNAKHWEFYAAGRSIDEVRREAREHLLNAASLHTSAYASDRRPQGNAERPIFLVGHQPELFHPGVWLKNFVLDQLARQHGATAVHVLIDNDIARTSIEVPVGSVERPSRATIDLDVTGEKVPWEERRLRDAHHFLAAGDEIVKALEPFVENPIVGELWANCGVESDLQGRLFGNVLAHMRHQLEQTWGLNTIEAPLSQICDSDSFRWFFMTLISQLPALHASYNGALAEYRKVHRLRSPSQPMPDLKRFGSRYEAPFWAWTSEHAQRHPLFVTQDAGGWVLDAEGVGEIQLAGSVKDFSEAIDTLARLEKDGVKIRPRALTTTIYLRLMLSDYFIHGIGGAKYDQVADCVIQDIFGIEPPSFLTASGTRMLPIDLPSAGGLSVKELDAALRAWEFQPEKALPESLSADDRRLANELMAEKRELMSVDSTRTPAQRHDELLRINEAIRQLAPHRRDELLQKRQDARAAEHTRAILSSREFSFCLFPESSLRDWLLGAADVTT